MKKFLIILLAAFAAVFIAAPLAQAHERHGHYYGWGPFGVYVGHGYRYGYGYGYGWPNYYAYQSPPIFSNGVSQGAPSTPVPQQVVNVYQAPAPVVDDPATLTPQEVARRQRQIILNAQAEAAAYAKDPHAGEFKLPDADNDSN